MGSEMCIRDRSSLLWQFVGVGRTATRQAGERGSAGDDKTWLNGMQAVSYTHLTLLAWMQRKSKRYKGHKVRAAGLVEKLERTRPDLFVHWRLGTTGEFA